jgi:hypothetical protein
LFARPFFLANAVVHAHSRNGVIPLAKSNFRKNSASLRPYPANAGGREDKKHQRAPYAQIFLAISINFKTNPFKAEPLDFNRLVCEKGYV